MRKTYKLSYVVFDGLWPLRFESFRLENWGWFFPKRNLKRKVNLILNCIKNYWFWSSRVFGPHLWKRRNISQFSGVGYHWALAKVELRLYWLEYVWVLSMKLCCSKLFSMRFSGAMNLLLTGNLSHFWYYASSKFPDICMYPIAQWRFFNCSVKRKE